MKKLNLKKLLSLAKKNNKKKDKSKSDPKKFIFKREQATIVIPTKSIKPILRRSELFNKEYEKEKALLGWK